MKRIFLLAFLIFAFACSSDLPRISSDQLSDKEGVLHLKATNEPFSGIAFSNFADGKTESEGTYKLGIPSGPIMHWFDNGQMRSKLVYNANGDHLNTSTWYDTGEKESSIEFSGQGSSVTEWYSNGAQKAKANYNSDNQREGTFQSWFENEQQKEDATYKNNLPESGQIKWHMNGEKASELTDTETGQLLTNWDDKGNKTEETNLSAGKKHGLYVRWHENGIKAEMGEFVNGKENGTFGFWLPSGVLVQNLVYENGKLANEPNPIQE